MRVDRENRAGRRADDTLCDTAHQELLDRAAPVRPRDDQVDVIRLGVASDYFGEIDPALENGHDVEGSPVIVGDECLQVALSDLLEIGLRIICHERHFRGI